jgi:hypothetical protein
MERTLCVWHKACQQISTQPVVVATYFFTTGSDFAASIIHFQPLRHSGTKCNHGKATSSVLLSSFRGLIWRNSFELFTVLHFFTQAIQLH